MPKLIAVMLVGMVYAGTLPAQATGGNPPPVTTQAATEPDSVPQQEMLPARVVEEAARLFNAKGTRRLRADTRISPDSTMDGDVAIIGGQLSIAGHIRGRVVAINSDVILEPSARLDKDILVVGGTVSNRENGRVRGDIRVYRPRMMLQEEGETIVPDPRYTDEGKWWS